MTRSSMTRIGARCLALAGMFLAYPALAEETEAPSVPPYSAWQGQAPHALPTPIVLARPPAPELPAPELARRPIELSPELLLGFASCAAGNADDTRCNGLSAGLGAAGSALWRVSPYFAFGGTLVGSSFGFRPPSSSGLQHASARGWFIGLLGRVYFLDHGMVEPYLELALGGGSVATSARESDEVQYDESAAGSALRVGGGIEFYLTTHVRVGPAFDWTRFQVAHVNRCAGSECIRLDEASYGHGTGFSSLSARLTILLGPGL